MIKAISHCMGLHYRKPTIRPIIISPIKRICSKTASMRFLDKPRTRSIIEEERRAFPIPETEP